MMRLRAMLAALLVSPLFTGAVTAQLQFNSPAFQLLQQRSGKEGQSPKPAPQPGAAIVFDAETLKQLGLTPEELVGIEDIATRISQQWVYGDALKDKALYYGALKGMVKQLDSHSDFYTPDEFKLFQSALNGSDVETPNVYSELIKPGVGYVYFTDFRAKTADEFLVHVSQLEKRGMNSLIIDVRNNPGGFLPTVIKIAGLFLSTGQRIVTVRDRSGKEVPIDDGHGRTISPLATSNGPYNNLPVKMLVNGNSASASEILAGALQDNGRARIYGATTYGKGSAQAIIPFPDGSALKLTVQKWYTPSGRSIQGNESAVAGVTERGGIVPDEPVGVGDEVEAKVMTRIYQKLMGALLDPPGPVSDPVLEKALQ